VQQIVQRNAGRMYYKQVAEKLVEELGKESKLEKSNDEQNIKRRVYDALNVLIASERLRKEGKQVLANHPAKQDLAVPRARAAVEEKRQQREELRGFRARLERLVARNASRPGSEDRLPLPLQGVLVRGPVRLEQEQAWFRLSAREPPAICTDMGMLKCLFQD
jgi:hypothetical protein